MLGVGYDNGPPYPWIPLADILFRIYGRLSDTLGQCFSGFITTMNAPRSTPFSEFLAILTISVLSGGSSRAGCLGLAPLRNHRLEAYFRISMSS